MASTSPLTPGMAVGGRAVSPPPFEPTAFHHLIDRNPARAACVAGRHASDAAARPTRRPHHATHADAVPIVAAWVALPCPADDANDPPPAAPIEPERLALMEPDEARDAIVALTPTQRVAQAVAQAAWLADFGYPVAHEEILALWAIG